MREILFKRSAVHNLAITDCREKCGDAEIGEGLMVPKDVLKKCDILPWEQVIVTKISGDNWVNRIKTFIIPGENDGRVEARGSLARFLKKGDLTCLITRTLLNGEELLRHKQSQMPIFDLGFDPAQNSDNLIGSRLDIEYGTEKIRAVEEFERLAKDRTNIKRFYLSSLVLDLVINKTHPDCLQGSAEIPNDIMSHAGIEKYQSVSVYNSTRGGVADTYAVPMPPKVVMTTGAMARFAKVGETVSVATYSIGTEAPQPVIVSTNGSEFFKMLEG